MFDENIKKNDIVFQTCDNSWLLMLCRASYTIWDICQREMTRVLRHSEGLLDFDSSSDFRVMKFCWMTRTDGENTGFY